MEIPEELFLEVEWMCWTIEGFQDQYLADNSGIGFNGKHRYFTKLN